MVCSSAAQMYTKEDVVFKAVTTKVAAGISHGHRKQQAMPLSANSLPGKGGPSNKLLGVKSYGPIKQCPLCGGHVIQAGAKYCQNCAYKNGLCSMCGKTIHNLSIHRQRDV